MTKTAVGKASCLALAMLLAGGVAAGCTSGTRGSPTEISRVGGVGLRLTVSPGVTVNTVNYTISGNGFSRTGTIDVSSVPGTTFSTTVSGIPAGNGYQVTLTATASDGSVGSGSATFNVTARLVTPVSVVLHFTPPAPTTGSVLINGTTNVCPLVSSLIASPASLAVGATSAVTAVASDADNQPSPLTYSWQVTPASVGTLSSSSIANPTFTAASAGTATLKVTVSDGDGPCATADGSLVSLEVQITVGGGSGSAGTGAAGTGAAGSGASGTGAAGIGAAGTGAAGSGASGTGAAGTGAAGTGAAGTGGAGTGAAGTAAGTGAAGTGVAGSGAAGTGAAGTGVAGTGAAGTGGGSNACLTCELAEHEGSTGCPDAYAAGDTLAGNAAAGPSAGTPKSTLFHQIIDCFHANHCVTNATSDCLCGIGANPSTCFQAASLADVSGPCKNEIAAGAESTSLADINSRFYNPLYAIGAAAGLSENCDQFLCTDVCL